MSWNKSYYAALDFVVDRAYHSFLGGSQDTRVDHRIIDLLCFIYSRGLEKIEYDIDQRLKFKIKKGAK